MELFEGVSKSESDSGLSGPLAHRMRPRTLEEFAGQHHIVGTGRLLRRVIQADQLTSLIFYGPPGTGKTTLARIIANTTRSHFITMNAVLSGVKELRAAIAEAQEHRNLYDRRTLLFIDEVHRWNKAQQDALLPWVENGTVILIGATTQNPYFEVNSALVSRSRIFQLQSLTDDDLKSIVRSAVTDPVRGYGAYAVSIDDDALEHLVTVSNGDARSLLNALELAVETTPDTFPPAKDVPIRITLEIAEESIQKKVVLYDKEGDYHFDTISAFIKSIRGSDPDATLYWMARMLYAGEDPRFIFRRMLISASEDIGLADPAALGIVESAAAAFDRVGMPEGRYFLAHAALYLATTGKSNSTMGFFEAYQAVENEKADDVPTHLRDSSRDAKGFGHGEGYLYPHAYRDHWVAQHYLPEALQGTCFYDPGSIGYEGERRIEVLRKREAQIAASAEHSGEVLTFSPPDAGRDRWMTRLIETRSATLEGIRKALFVRAGILRHHTILDLNADHALLLWEAVRSAPEGGVTGIVHGSGDRLRFLARKLPEYEQPTLVEGTGLKTRENGTTDPVMLPESFDRIIGFNALSAHRTTDVAGLYANLLADDGKIALCEPLPGHGQLLADLEPVRESCPEAVVEEFRNAELRIRNSGAIAQYARTPESIASTLESTGLQITWSGTLGFGERRELRKEHIDSWLGPEDPAETTSGSYARELHACLDGEIIAQVRGALLDSAGKAPVEWLRVFLVIEAKHQGDRAGSKDA